MLSNRLLLRRLTAPVAGLALALGSGLAAGPALAAAPTLDAPKTFHAGQKTPVDVGGNRLHHGDTIRKGTQLLRWRVTLNGRSNAPVALRCPAGTVHVGLAALDHPDVYFGVIKGSSYRHRAIRVRFYPARGVDPDGATDYVYALCRTR